MIRRTAAIVHEKIVAAKSDTSFETAWSAYHDSFADNLDEVLDGIYVAFKANVKYINPSNLNGTVSLFKDLGRLDQAKEILDHYMHSRKEPRSFFDLEEYVFAEYITDPDVRAAFNARTAELTETRDIGAILASIKNSWNDDAIATLASASVDEYVKIFKVKTGLELRRLLSNGFQFDRLTNATGQMKAIPRKIRAALEVIGNESPINARRVKRFGVTVALPAEVPVVSDNAEEFMRVAEFPPTTPT